MPISIVTDTYAVWGTVPGEKSHPQPTEAERAAATKANRWPHNQMLKDLHWDAATFERARGYGFPSPIGRQPTRWGRPDDCEAVYSRAQVAQWRDAFKAFAKLVK